MKTTWLITSALSTGVGIFDPPTRTAQTHATITSILQHCPDANVILVEGGRPFDFAQIAELVQRCNLFLDATNNEYIQALQHGVFAIKELRNEMGGITGTAKSLSEFVILKFALERLKTSAAMLAVDRIFKISGRYQLSPLFNPHAYTGIGDKYVLRRRQPSWMENAKQRIGTDCLFSSRLWSFAPGQLNDTLSHLTRMIQELLDYRGGSYIDAEHLLFKYLGALSNIHELDHTHVMGTTASEGAMTYD